MMKLVKMGGMVMPTEAILSNDGEFTLFSYNNNIIRFKTSQKLEKYTKLIEWDNGYIVVMAKYSTLGEVEDYIDLVPILENLYIDSSEFLKPIENVRICYD